MTHKLIIAHNYIIAISICLVSFSTTLVETSYNKAVWPTSNTRIMHSSEMFALVAQLTSHMVCLHSLQNDSSLVSLNKSIHL